MIGASLYVIGCSARNRITRRLRRLREPRYLIGAIVAAAYILFQLLGAVRVRRDGNPVEVAPELMEILPSLAGAFLLLLAGLAWLLPSSRSSISLSEAEAQFLLPAPVSRRQLLIHRLMRSQLALLFAALVPAIFMGFGTGSVAARVLRWVALWVVFLTARVYFTGVTLARHQLTTRSSGALLAGWAPLIGVLCAIGTLGASVVGELLSRPIPGADDLLWRAGHVVGTAPAAIVLWPFTALVRPFFQSPPREFASALAAAVAVLAVACAWVLRNADAFDEALAQTPPLRVQRRISRTPALTLRAAGWTLPPSGRTEPLFFWKNGLQTLRRTSLGTALQYGTPAVILGVVFASAQMAESNARSLAMALTTFALINAGFAILFGPQMLTYDLRSDLRHLALLKTWPVKAADIVRGEMLWPGTVVTLLAWLALLCAAIFSAAAFPERSITWRLSVTGAAIILVPALVFAQYAVHNAVAVLLPAWTPLDDQRPRGLDAMGQRMILLTGVVLALVAAIAPGSVAGGLVGLVLYQVVGIVALVPAATACLAVVGIELVVATEALGRAYERIDVTEIERVE